MRPAAPPARGTTTWDHHARVLRDTCAARLARALLPTDFAAVFANPDQLSLFAPSTDSMRPVLDTRPGIHVSSVPGAGVPGEDDALDAEPLDDV
jgi:hypothetical protein